MTRPVATTMDGVPEDVRKLAETSFPSRYHAGYYLTHEAWIEVISNAILADRAARPPAGPGVGEACRKLSSELDFIQGISQGLLDDAREFQENWPASKRGSRLQRLFSSMVARVETFAECAKDAEQALASLSAPIPAREDPEEDRRRHSRRRRRVHRGRPGTVHAMTNTVSVYQHPKDAGVVIRIFMTDDRSEFVEAVLQPTVAVNLSVDLAREAGRLLQINRLGLPSRA